MSINYAQSSADILGRASVSSKYFSPADSPSVTQYTYVRNPSWLAIPTMSASDQAVYALHAVFREGNYVAFTCAGNYTVNWGDNVTESFNSGSTAYHIYDYNSSSFDGTNAPVQFTASNDTVVRDNHGYSNNNSVIFAEIDNTVSGSMGGVERGARYYVVNATQNNFQISLTQNGSPIDITSNGTGRILNYKQAIITITPQSGQNLSVINLNVKHNATGLQTYSSGFLDLNIGSPNLTTLRIGSSASSTTYVITHHMLARARLYSSALVNCQYMFYNCLGLEQATIDGIGASSVNFTQMFGECYGVYDIKFNCNTAAVTNIGSMFINCRSLIYAPFFNTSNATTASSLFQDCQSLEYLPPYDFGAATTVASMFLRCRALKYCPGFDTKNATTFVSLFQDCAALQGFGAFNAIKVTTINSMCNNCYSLDSIPMMDFKSVTTATNAFNGCYSLKTIPKFNFEKLANAGNVVIE